MRRPRLLIVILLALLAAACGGSGEITVVANPTATPEADGSPQPTVEEATPDAEPTATPEDDGGDGGAEPAATPTPLPEPTAEATATPEPAPAGPAETVVITYDSNSFGFEQDMVATIARDGSYRIDYDDGSIEVRDAQADTQTSYFVFDDDVSVGDREEHRDRDLAQRPAEQPLQRLDRPGPPADRPGVRDQHRQRGDHAQQVEVVVASAGGEDGPRESS